MENKNIKVLSLKEYENLQAKVLKGGKQSPDSLTRGCL